MGLPAYVWLGAAAVGLLVGLYLRSRGSSTTTTNVGTAVPATTATDTGDFGNATAGGSIAPAGTGLDPGTVAALLGGDSSGGDSPLADSINNLAATILGGGVAAPQIASSAGSGSSAVGKAASPPKSGTTPKPASKPQAPPVVKILKNGAKLTTYADGHQTEQAPGKNAYVVKK